MSIDSRLLNLAVNNKKPTTIIAFEYINMLETYRSIFNKKYVGRDSHIKVFAYRTVERIYGAK